MSFHDVRLPEFVSVFAQATYEYSTLYATSMSGREVRHSANNHHLLKYLIQDCVLSEQEFYIFQSFFKARMGMRYSFRFKDFVDHKVQRQVIAMGNGEQKKFQLFKRYNDPFMPHDRVITRPISSTVRLFTGETEISSGYNINNGLIEFEEPILDGHTLTASFDFDVEVRFNNDNLSYSNQPCGTIKLAKLELVEVI